MSQTEEQLQSGVSSRIPFLCHLRHLAGFPLSIANLYDWRDNVPGDMGKDVALPA